MKLFHFSLPNAVIAARGQCFVHQALVTSILNYQAISFDLLVEVMPEVLAQMNDALRFGASQQGMSDVLRLDAQVALVGWSDARETFELHVATQDERGNLLGIQSNHAVCMPWEGSWGSLPVGEARDAESMSELMRHQVKHMKRDFPNDAAGGRMILATMTRTQTTIEDRGQIVSL